MNARVLTLFLGLAVAVTVASAATGCQKGQRSKDISTASGSAEAATVSSREDAQNRAGALAWSQNCMRCHNLRNPNERSDREWVAIMHHMRVRGNLTVEEHQLILRFLQSAN